MKPFTDVSFVMGVRTLDMSTEDFARELTEVEEAFNQILKERGYVVGGSFDHNYYPDVVADRLKG